MKLVRKFGETEGAGLVEPGEEKTEGNSIAVHRYLTEIAETMEPNTSWWWCMML